MIRISNIRLKTGVPLGKLPGKIEDRLGIARGSISGLRIVKESVDARKKPEVYRVFSLEIETSLSDEEMLRAAGAAGIDAARAAEESFELPRPARPAASRPVVCGFGPCGLFAALTLAMQGLRPIALERGPAMDERVAAVESFWNGGGLRSRANVQFGEGGAGTFSDGKLTTGTSAPARSFILGAFVDAGASPEILYRQKPHIGTDVIRRAVVEIRKKIVSLGGEVRFGTLLTGIEIKNGAVCAALTDNGRIETDTLILATGHSARDTAAQLKGMGLLMEQKPFSIGLRIEHLQTATDVAQYGAPAAELGLWPAEYKLNCRTSSGRGVYTFCMCPGGYVVGASSGSGLVVTNGMSYAGRDAENSNSALLCDVYPPDFGSDDPLAGHAFQERYERLAFGLGGEDLSAPVQRVSDFLGLRASDFSGGSASSSLLLSQEPAPTVRPGFRWADVSACLPDFAAASLREALPVLGRRLHGFDAPGAVLTGVESRSSSPVRIKRNEDGEALTVSGNVIKGLYPAGEGAGYAGGIM